MAYSKICVYCHVVTLEGYNAEQRKYYEQGTTQLHTRERCAEARSKAGLPAHTLSATPPKPPAAIDQESEITRYQSSTNPEKERT